MKIRGHILFIVENNPAPHDIRVWAEAKAARDMGYEVSIISPENKKAQGKYQKIDEIEIYRHWEPQNATGVKGFICELSNALFWESLLSIKIYLKKPYHIIHAANPPDHIFLIALFYKFLGVKFIFDHHDLSPELYQTKFNKKNNYLYRILIMIEKFSCKLADAVISTNLSYKKIVMHRHSIDGNKIFVVRNDPDIKNYASGKFINMKKDNNKVKILYLGSINSQDGIDILLKALNYLVNSLNEDRFTCDIVGGGDSLEFSKQLFQKLKLNGFVNFKGWVLSKKEVKEHLYSADICVEPAPNNSVNKHSTFIKIMEYMAAGKPIVAFDLTETRYSTGGNAIFVKEGHIMEFARAVQKLISDPHLREALGSAGKERIKEKLNWNNASRNLERAYKSIQ